MASDLKFRVTLDTHRQLVVLAPPADAAPVAPPAETKTKKPLIIKRGSTTVKIYGVGPYTIAWRDRAGAGRQRAVRASLPDAKNFAEAKATELANGETWKQQMGAADYASYLRSRELLAQIGSPPLEVAVGIYTQCVQILPAEATPLEASRYFVEHRPAGVTVKNIPDLVADLLTARKKRGKHGRPISQRWAGALNQQLELFAQKFQGPLDAVSGSQIETWLDSLKVGLHTRSNYQAAILQLSRYAKFKRHIPKDWNELADIESPDLPDAEAKILTPDQLNDLLSTAPSNLVPFLAITAFSGVRHEEIRGIGKPLLDWRAIDLDHGTLYVQARISKTGHDRQVILSPQLITWLRPYAQRNGPVCPLKNTSNALWRAKRSAGIPCKANETRNTLRKSYISYRLAQGRPATEVAEECGTSVAKILTNYKRCRPAGDGRPSALKPEADRWFSILPVAETAMIQINFNL